MSASGGCRVSSTQPSFVGIGAPTTIPLTGPDPKAGTSLPKEHCYFSCERDPADNEIVSTGRFWHADVTYVTETTTIAEGITIIPTVSELMGTFVPAELAQKIRRILDDR